MLVGDYGDLTGLLALRQQLQIDLGLEAFFQANYDKSANHIVGLKSQFAATDYPFLCYVPNEAVRGGLGGDVEIISLIIGIYQPDVSNGLALGAIHLGIVGALVFEALNNDWSGTQTQFLGTVREANDLQVTHPAYRKEIQIPLKVTRTR